MNQPFDTKCAQLDDLLGVGRSFDMVSRELYVGGRRAKMWVVNGYAKDMLLERAVEKLQEVETLDGISGVDELLRRYITVCDAGTSRDRMQAVTDVFAGKTLLIIDGFSGGILLDAKTFPTRSVQEPDAGKVLRGSHDGFVESIMENAALLRRRIRDPALTLERIRLGGRSQCDVALCYMEGRADANTLSQLREKLRRIDLRSVSMSQETIAEAIAPKQWYNPFPKVRYTERPDVATASVMEGDILVLIDNTPVVMLLPVSLLRFNEEINDYYFPPLTGAYLRITRLLTMLVTLFVTPLWLLALRYPDKVPELFRFVLIDEAPNVPVVLQLLMLEFIIDGLKLSSLNTPNMLSSAFSIIAGIIVSDFAVQSGWFCSQTLLYMAFVAMANYSQPGYELGYAIKFMRMLLLVAVALFGIWGFALGTAFTVWLILSTKIEGKKGYFWPIIPFSPKGLGRLLFRLK